MAFFLLRSPNYPWRSCNKLCLEAFACANIEVAACDKICAFVILVVSWAKSASSILDLAASVLTCSVVKLFMTASRRFSYAPKLARKDETLSIAVSSALKAAWDVATDDTESPSIVVDAFWLWLCRPRVSRPVCALPISPSSRTIALPSSDERVNTPKAVKSLEVTEIVDVTPIPHNGCRPPKRRRV